MKNKILMIVGPSGAGKTTLQNNIFNNYNVVVPYCMVTREKRCDDIDTHYLFVSKSDFEYYEKNNRFFLTTGLKDRYGFLNPDVDFKIPLLFISSYKYAIRMVDKGYPVYIITLSFNDIEKYVYERILERNLSINDIENKVLYALNEHKEYFETIKRLSSLLIYTDHSSIEETYNQTANWIDDNGLALKKERGRHNA